ncbi:hypothetical protein K2X85_15450 [bacterium]|nr:hypothetical protein [bacterium]
MGIWSFAGGPAIGKEFVEVFGGVDADGGQDIAEVTEGIDPLAASLQAAVGTQAFAGHGYLRRKRS